MYRPVTGRVEILGDSQFQGWLARHSHRAYSLSGTWKPPKRLSSPHSIRIRFSLSDQFLGKAPPTPPHPRLEFYSAKRVEVVRIAPQTWGAHAGRSLSVPRSMARTLHPASSRAGARTQDSHNPGETVFNSKHSVPLSPPLPGHRGCVPS